MHPIYLLLEFVRFLARSALQATEVYARFNPLIPQPGKKQALALCDRIHAYADQLERLHQGRDEPQEGLSVGPDWAALEGTAFHLAGRLKRVWRELRRLTQYRLPNLSWYAHVYDGETVEAVTTRARKRLAKELRSFARELPGSTPTWPMREFDVPNGAEGERLLAAHVSALRGNILRLWTIPKTTDVCTRGDLVEIDMKHGTLKVRKQAGRTFHARYAAYTTVGSTAYSQIDLYLALQGMSTEAGDLGLVAVSAPLTMTDAEFAEVCKHSPVQLKPVNVAIRNDPHRPLLWSVKRVAEFLLTAAGEARNRYAGLSQPVPEKAAQRAESVVSRAKALLTAIEEVATLPGDGARPQPVSLETIDSLVAGAKKLGVAVARMWAAVGRHCLAARLPRTPLRMKREEDLKYASVQRSFEQLQERLRAFETVFPNCARSGKEVLITVPVEGEPSLKNVTLGAERVSATTAKILEIPLADVGCTRGDLVEINSDMQLVRVLDCAARTTRVAYETEMPADYSGEIPFKLEFYLYLYGIQAKRVSSAEFVLAIPNKISDVTFKQICFRSPLPIWPVEHESTRSQLK